MTYKNLKVISQVALAPWILINMSFPLDMTESFFIQTECSHEGKRYGPILSYTRVITYIIGAI